MDVSPLLFFYSRLEETLRLKKKNLNLRNLDHETLDSIFHKVSQSYIKHIEVKNLRAMVEKKG